MKFKMPVFAEPNFAAPELIACPDALGLATPMAIMTSSAD